MESFEVILFTVLSGDSSISVERYFRSLAAALAVIGVVVADVVMRQCLCLFLGSVFSVSNRRSVALATNNILWVARYHIMTTAFVRGVFEVGDLMKMC